MMQKVILPVLEAEEWCDWEEVNQMGALYDMRMLIENIIGEKRMDLVPTRGAIGMQAGFLLSLVSENSPDDPAKIEALRQAVLQVLKVRL
jgi:hypothetical protein